MLPYCVFHVLSALWELRVLAGRSGQGAWLEKIALTRLAKQSRIRDLG